MTDIYSGDPKIVLTENGAKLVFSGGQPVMDQGLENLALISLFTSPGWSGNTLFQDINQQVGLSNFLIISKQSITLTMINDLRQAAIDALNNSAFGNITVDIQNPNSYRLNITITISPPGQDIQTLILTRNGENWLLQNSNPAYRRI